MWFLSLMLPETQSTQRQWAVDQQFGPRPCIKSFQCGGKLWAYSLCKYVGSTGAVNLVQNRNLTWSIDLSSGLPALPLGPAPGAALAGLTHPLPPFLNLRSAEQLQDLASKDNTSVPNTSDGTVYNHDLASCYHCCWSLVSKGWQSPGTAFIHCRYSQ